MRYRIDCLQGEIRLLAEEPGNDEPRNTEFIFSGVEAHHFEQDYFSSILGHITETPLASFCERQHECFRRGWFESGWPRFWRDSLPEAIGYLRSSSIRAFEWTSSCGMHGWVLAREVRLRPVDSHMLEERRNFLASGDPMDETWMRRALTLAAHAEQLGEVPVGAVLVRDGTGIGEGWNCPISTRDPTAHAEIVALRAGGLAANNYRLVDTTLYVTLEPCAMCMAAIVHARVKRLIFGAPDPKRGAVCSVLKLADAEFLNHKVEWVGGVLEAECSSLLRGFFLRRR